MKKTFLPLHAFAFAGLPLRAGLIFCEPIDGTNSLSPVIHELTHSKL
jgi:hypothetical protein